MGEWRHSGKVVLPSQESVRKETPMRWILEKLLEVYQVDWLV